MDPVGFHVTGDALGVGSAAPSWSKVDFERSLIPGRVFAPKRIQTGKWGWPRQSVLAPRCRADVDCRPVLADNGSPSSLRFPLMLPSGSMVILRQGIVFGFGRTVGSPASLLPQVRSGRTAAAVGRKASSGRSLKRRSETCAKSTVLRLRTDVWRCPLEPSSSSLSFWLSLKMKTSLSRSFQESGRRVRPGTFRRTRFRASIRVLLGEFPHQVLETGRSCRSHRRQRCRAKWHRRSGYRPAHRTARGLSIPACRCYRKGCCDRHRE